MITAVIFDMDGVIVDSEPIHYKIERDLFDKLGIDISREEHLTFLGSTSFYMWSRFKTRFNLAATVEELIKQKDDAYFNYLVQHHDWPSVPGAPELIRKLHENGIKLAVASSAVKREIEIVLDRLNLARYFPVTVNGTEVAHSKPAPDIFLLAAKRLGVKLQDCVVIEDSRNGVAASKAAGIKCIGLLNEHSGTQDLTAADSVVSSLVGLDTAFLL